MVVATAGIGIDLLFGQMGISFKAPLKQIQKRGTIRMITTNNATSYYTYRESSMGFEYELAKAFADHLGVALEVIVPEWDTMFEVLNSGQGDFIAAGMTITEPREQIALFSQPYMPVQQKFIHHKLKFGIKNISSWPVKPFMSEKAPPIRNAWRKSKHLELIWRFSCLTMLPPRKSSEWFLRKKSNSPL